MGKSRLRGDEGVAAQGSWWGVPECRTNPALWPRADLNTYTACTQCRWKSTLPPPPQASRPSESREIFNLHNFTIKWSNSWPGCLETGCGKPRKHRCRVHRDPPNLTRRAWARSLFHLLPRGFAYLARLGNHSHQELGKTSKNLFLHGQNVAEIFVLSGSHEGLSHNQEGCVC